MPDPTPTSAATPPPAAPPPGGDRPGRRARQLYTVAVAALVVGAYASNLADLARTWWNEPDYSHGFLVLPVAGAIAWRWLQGFRASDLRPSWVGLALLVGVLGARAWSFERGDFWVETATILPAVAALVLACGGWPLLRRAWPAVAFLVFMLTIPPTVDAKLSQPLQKIAATTSGAILRLSGLWVLNEGNVLDLGGERLEVATACNGLAMLMSLSATVAAIILLVPMPRWKRFGLLLSALPIALACNVLRIAATAYCYETFGSAAGRKFAHDAAGWLMMPLALVLIGLEMAWSSWMIRDSEPAPPPPASPLPGMAYVTAGR